MAVVLIAMFVWSYMSQAHRRAASRSVGRVQPGRRAPPPNLEQLRQSAEEYPGTKMQQLADITWADGQVWLASRNYLYNRAAAKEALDQCDERLIRAFFNHRTMSGW